MYSAKVRHGIFSPNISSDSATNVKDTRVRPTHRYNKMEIETHPIKNKKNKSAFSPSDIDEDYIKNRLAILSTAMSAINADKDISRKSKKGRKKK